MSSNNNNTFFLVLLVLLLLLTSTMAARPLAAAPANKSMTYAAFKPPVGQRAAGEVFAGCLPKGFHRNSGPSRYINYEPAGGTTTTSTILMCDTEKH
ncbi:unnamed protein product [Linum trigynum]|uniref:Uncharacterized protein n=1 Tax=Linum trigynum TaxID=586398 RepID=A0AAV2DMH6_9ROSI